MRAVRDARLAGLGANDSRLSPPLRIGPRRSIRSCIRQRTSTVCETRSNCFAIDAYADILSLVGRLGFLDY